MKGSGFRQQEARFPLAIMKYCFKMAFPLDGRTGSSEKNQDKFKTDGFHQSQNRCLIAKIACSLKNRFYVDAVTVCTSRKNAMDKSG